MIRFWLCLAVLVSLFVTRTASADRVQVYSVQGADCGKCGAEIRPYLKKVEGVKKWTFDARSPAREQDRR
jgi:hypothetical protein